MRFLEYRFDRPTLAVCHAATAINYVCRINASKKHASRSCRQRSHSRFGQFASQTSSLPGKLRKKGLALAPEHDAIQGQPGLR